MKYYFWHGHNNVLVLELRNVAYWYQSAAAAVPSNPSRNVWRDAWRKSKGNDKKL
jgi:hypothetical protein